MIEGLTATWVSNTESLKEIELKQTLPAAQDSDFGEEDQSLVLTVILVVGPPDPNALSYLVPRSVFERGLPVHVGALSFTTDDQAVEQTAGLEPNEQQLLDAMLDILEVMNPHDIVVFICDTPQTVEAAISLMEP